VEGVEVVVVVGEVVVVVVGEVVVVVGEVVVVVVGEVVVVVVVVVDEGVSTKYAAIPATMRITTMTMTAEVVLIAPRLLIFILAFVSSLEIIKALITLCALMVGQRHSLKQSWGRMQTLPRRN